jgi:small subunit ribosomal protein S21
MFTMYVEAGCQERATIRPGNLPTCRPFVLYEGVGQLQAGLGRLCVAPSPARRELPVEVQVRDNNVDQALRALKKKMQREGLYREMRMRRHYEKPSEKRAREKAEAVRRYRKLLRKRRERDEI